MMWIHALISTHSFLSPTCEAPVALNPKQEENKYWIETPKWNDVEKIYNHCSLKILNKLLEEIIDLESEYWCPRNKPSLSGFHIDVGCKKREAFSSLGKKGYLLWGPAPGLNRRVPKYLQQFKVLAVWLFPHQSWSQFLCFHLLFAPFSSLNRLSWLCWFTGLAPT